MKNKNILYVSLVFSILIMAGVLVSASTSVADIADVAKFGKITLDDNWKTVRHNAGFSNPVVIAKPISYQGVSPATIRVRNVTSDTFEIHVEEWLYQDGTHNNETVSYMVVEAGSYELGGKKIQAGIFLTGTNWTNVYFNETFNSTPVVLTQSQTLNEVDTIVTRNQNVTTIGFETRLQEEEASSGTHVSEAVGYIAAEVGLYNNATKFEVGRTNSSITHNWYNLSFSQTFSSNPYFLADMQTYNGGNTANIRYDNLAINSVEIQIDEEQSKDIEVDHNSAESVGYFVLE